MGRKSGRAWVAETEKIGTRIRVGGGGDGPLVEGGMGPVRGWTSTSKGPGDDRLQDIREEYSDADEDGGGRGQVLWRKWGVSDCWKFGDCSGWGLGRQVRGDRSPAYLATRVAIG